MLYSSTRSTGALLDSAVVATPHLASHAIVLFDIFTDLKHLQVATRGKGKLTTPFRGILLLPWKFTSMKT